MIFEIREAREGDARALQEIFEATYGGSYCYRWVYDDVEIRKLILSADTVVLVAEDRSTGQVAGTAAIVQEIGAYSDLVGEFGRLAVHPVYQRRGAAHLLMQARIEHATDRLHVGLVEARAAHPYSQTVAIKNGFAPVGFLPLKLRFTERESAVPLVRYFGDGLALRRNNPRVIPEAYPLAAAALEGLRLPCDAIVDEGSEVYPALHDFVLGELTTRGYASLLRLERGRVEHRQIFGPMRLHYGFFRLKASDCTYLLAKEDGQVIGALGVMRDDLERTVRAFELIMQDDRPVQFLIEQLLTVCRDQWSTEYVEIDVSAYAPDMQRTLLGLGFVPAAFVPALAFHRSERLDVVKMVYVFPRARDERVGLTPRVASMREIVLRNLELQPVLPRIGELIQRAVLFQGLAEEQAKRVASLFTVAHFSENETLFHEGDPADELYVVLDGSIEIRVDGGGTFVGRVEAGDCCGEMALLLGDPHSATAIATGPVEAARLSVRDVTELMEHRPDIGVILYRNLGVEVSRKLRRLDRAT